jgi:hypothetical protein
MDCNEEWRTESGRECKGGTGPGGCGVSLPFEANASLCFRRVLQLEAPSPAHWRREALKEERRAVLDSKQNHPNKNPGVPRSDFTLFLSRYGMG